MQHRNLFGAVALLLLTNLIACGGGGGGSSAGGNNGGGGGSSGAGTPPIVSEPPLISHDLIDPTPSSGDSFGRSVVILENNTIVVTDPFDSSVAVRAGAVHVYAASGNGQPLYSIYGEDANDNLGSKGIVPLSNGHFLIVSPFDDVDGVNNAGSVRLIHGTFGSQIGAALVGDDANDQIGDGDVIDIGNGNFAVASTRDDINGVIDAGSVRLMSASTGAQIAVYAGESLNDRLGFSGLEIVSNDNLVIASSLDNDEDNGINDAGSIILIDGGSGAQIAPTLHGDEPNENLGSGGVTALLGGASRNFVVASRGDDSLATNGGSVQLMSGLSGNLINLPIQGNDSNDLYGRVTALPIGAYTVVAPGDDVNGVSNVGSMHLLSGGDGANFIPAPGPRLVGQNAGDGIGSGGVVFLPTDTAIRNFAVISPNARHDGIGSAGHIYLYNGSLGLVVGSQPVLSGTHVGYELGSSGVIGLPNGNFAIASENANGAMTANAGAIQFLDGGSGTPVGSPTFGENTGDFLGSGGITVLGRDRLIVVSPRVDRNGIMNAGTVQLFDGETGVANANPVLEGDTGGDLENAVVAASSGGTFFVLGMPDWDNNGLFASGRVRLISE